MATLRFKALDEISRRELIETKLSDQKISGYFGADVFDRETMRQYIAKELTKASAMRSTKGGASTANSQTRSHRV